MNLKIFLKVNHKKIWWELVKSWIIKQKNLKMNISLENARNILKKIWIFTAQNLLNYVAKVAWYNMNIWITLLLLLKNFIAHINYVPNTMNILYLSLKRKESLFVNNACLKVKIWIKRSCPLKSTKRANNSTTKIKQRKL